MNNSEQKTTRYDENPELILRYRAGDGEAGDELVRRNLPLVLSLARRFADRGVEQSDIVECGTLGLVKAMRSFDPERGCAFSTYAVPLILGEMRRFLRDDGFIKVSREQRRLAAILVRERERRVAAGESTDIGALAAAVGISREDAASALFSESPVRSLDESIFDDDGRTTLGSTIAAEGDEHSSIDRLALTAAIEKLCPERRRLVYLRYFRDLSQTECAKLLGISQVKVSREEKRIIAELSAELA